MNDIYCDRDNLIFSQMHKKAREILKDVSDNVGDIDENSDLSREELRDKLIGIKKIIDTYEDDYIKGLEVERNKDLRAKKPVSIDYYIKAEITLQGLSSDYKAYGACLEYNKTKFQGGIKFKYYGMSAATFRTIKAELDFMRRIGEDNKDYNLYIKHVCYEGKTAEWFATYVLNKRTTLGVTHLRSRLVEEIAERFAYNDYLNNGDDTENYLFVNQEQDEDQKNKHYPYLKSHGLH